jgi:hypothetical protein
MDTMAKSAVIKPNSEINLIRLDCKGSNLILYVNGTQLDSRQDSDFAEGDIGLLAGTYANPGLKVVFDNLLVTQP